MSSCESNPASKKALDSHNLSTLPTTYSPRVDGNGSLLWTRGSGYENEYYQFNIKSKTEKMSSSIEDDDPHQGPTTMCYICNLSVPTAYLTDHETSLKHIAFAKITDVVLQRARQNMMNKSDRSIVKRNDSMYFCGPCGLAVRRVDEESHDKSKAHKRSVYLDRLLYELVDFFTNEDHENRGETVLTGTNSNGNIIQAESDTHAKDDTVIISDIKAALDRLQTEKANATCNVVKNNRDLIENNRDLIENNRDLIENNRDLIENNRDNDYIKSYFNGSQTESENSVLKEVNNEDLNNLTYVDADVVIETPEGYRVIVSQNNFHGFDPIDKTVVWCKLCKVTATNKNEHMHLDKHVKGILKPFSNLHCMRILDDCWSHCVICNEVIDNTDVHALYNATHNTLLQKALDLGEKEQEGLLQRAGEGKKRNPEKLPKVITVDEWNSNELPKGVAADQFAASELLNDIRVDKLKLNELWKVITNNKSKPDEVLLKFAQAKLTELEQRLTAVESKYMNTKSRHHFNMKLVEDSTDLICRVCNVYIEDSAIEVKAHVTTTDHRIAYKELLKEHNIIKKKSNLFCEPCNMAIMMKNEFNHIEKSSHDHNLTSYLENYPRRTSKSSSDKDIETNTKAQKNKAHSYTVCNVLVADNPNSIKSDNDGERYQNKLVEMSNLTDDAVAVDDSDSNTAPSDLHQLMDLTDNVEQVMCKLCLFIIRNADDDIDNHIVGNKHRSNLINYLNANCVKIVGDEYYCKICTVFTKNDTEFILHMSHPRHKLRRPNQNNQMFTTLLSHSMSLIKRKLYHLPPKKVKPKKIKRR